MMTNDTYIALGALVVSLVAVSVSVWSGLADRKHMKLSVRPVAAIPVADFENRLAVWVSNKGLGPMRIKKLTVADPYETVHSDLNCRPTTPRPEQRGKARMKDEG